MAERKRIVILGGGFAGVNAAWRLERLLRREKHVEITLVDGENFSLFTPLLPEVPSGSIQPKHTVFPLRALLRRTVVRQAEVHVVDLEKRLVLAAHCPACRIYPLPYDHLVLAFGAVSNFFGLAGVEEHALTMKSLADATALHAHMIDKLEHAELEETAAVRRELLTFVVAGGGFAGVEIAAELNDFVREARRYYPGMQAEEVRMVLVHSGSRILPEVSESLSAYALRKLRRQGVEVLLQTRIAAYDGTAICLSNGEKISSRTLVWTAGIAPCPILDKLDLPKNAAGRIEVEPTLQVKGQPGLWALGDCAGVPDLVKGGLCPPTAQHALRQGRWVARNIASVLRGAAPEPFRYRPRGLLAGLGRRSAVAEVLGLKFSGFFAWWLWRTVYLLKLPGLERKVRVALDWTLDLVFPRDIVYLRPLHTARGPVAGPRTLPDAVQVGRPHNVAVVGLGLGLAVVGCGSPTTIASDKMGSNKMGGDKMGGDKMNGDKMSGKMEGDKMAGKMGGDKMEGEKKDKS
jgi:NADH dehydrogenase